eukprot:801655-Pyramimonas_sp.AAC.1
MRAGRMYDRSGPLTPILGVRSWPRWTMGGVQQEVSPHIRSPTPWPVTPRCAIPWVRSARGIRATLLCIHGAAATEAGREGRGRGRGTDTVETHAKKHPACLQVALGILGFDGFAAESMGFPHRKINGRHGVSGFGFLRKVSCGLASTVIATCPCTDPDFE